MKTAARHILGIAGLVLLISLVVVQCRLNEKMRHAKTCERVSVVIADDYTFVTPKEIKATLDRGYGSYIGERIDSVDLSKVEAIIDRESAVKKSEAYMTPDGTLNIVVTQREPSVRFETGEGGFYCDEKGFIFPLQSNYTPLVPIVDGAVPLSVPKGFKGEPKTEKERAWVHSILSVLSVMERKGGVWKDNISEITVQGNGDLVMIPREGKERFIFGGPERAQEKLSLIGEYYRSVLPGVGPGYYSSVNVKYSGQLVCRRD